MSLVEGLQILRLVLVGGVAFAAVYCLRVENVRRQDRALAVFGVWAAFVGLGLIGRYIQHAATSPDAVDFGIRLAHTGVFATPPLAVLFVVQVRRPRVGRWFGVHLGVIAAPLLGVWTTDLLVSSELQQYELVTGELIWGPVPSAAGPAGIPYGLAVSGYLWLLLKRGTVRRDWDQRVLAVSVAFAAVPAVVNDSLLYAGLVSTFDCLTIALAGVVIAVSTMMLRRAGELFVELEDSVRDRARELEERQLELDRALVMWRSVLAAIPEAVCVLRDGVIDYVNRAGVELFGRPRPDIEGVQLSELAVRGRQVEMCAALDEFARAPRTRAPVSMEFSRPDGAVVTGDVVGLNVHISGDVRTLVTIRDVSERSQLLAQLQLADRLASVGTLASGVAHEINNPLTYLLANLSFAKSMVVESGGHLDADAIAELMDLMGDCEEGGARIASIVRDLRAFARADDASHDVDIHDVLRKTINLARMEIRHRAKLIEQLGPVPLVKAEPGRLGQVFLNLLVNAAQAITGVDTDNEITVATRTEDGFAVVEVSDTGCGIEPELISRVFDPFVTSKPMGEGTGLGLSICHGIVTGFGGQISLHRRDKGGTLARVAFPSSAASQATRAVQRPAPRTGDGRTSVLIVDDEPGVRRALRRLLVGYQVTDVGSGREAIDALSSNRFDAIVCDVMMPGVSGLEVYESAVDLGYDGRMIMITGGACTDRAAEFLAGVDAPVIDKPIDASALISAIERGKHAPAP